MPDVITHAIFAQESMDKLEDHHLKQMLTNYKYIYYLGAQGPDIFYFINLIYKTKIEGYKGLGNVMHDKYIDDFFKVSFQYLKENYNESLHCYLMGFICHHSLDRNTHPYVYHVTGIYKVDQPETKQYRGNHVRLERAIDSIMLMEKWNIKKPHKFNIYKNFLQFELNETVFMEFYDYVIKEVYGLNDAGVIFLNAINNYKLYIKFLYDPYGLKKTLGKLIDVLFNKDGKIVFETIFYYNNINKAIDYLNLNHKEWVHPVDGLGKSTKSFIDLYNCALKESVDELNQLNKYIKYNTSIIVKDLSYSTGRHWKENKEMKYFNNIFSK